MTMSSYFKKLRAKVGNDLLVLPSVTGLIRNTSGEYLLVRQPNMKWGLPGGMLEPNEVPIEGLHREMTEELSVDIEVLGLIDIFGGENFLISYPNGDRVSYVVAVYACDIGSQVPVLEEAELVEMKFVAPKEVYNLELQAWVSEILIAGHNYKNWKTM